MPNYDKEIDLSGLNCPMPVLRTKAAFAKMSSDQVLKIITTNPDSLKEIPLFSQQMGHQILDFSEHGDKYIYYIKKA